MTGQNFAVSGRSGDWVAIWCSGKKAWLHDPAGQVYVAKDLVGADYYDATTFDALDTYRVFTGSTRFYEISFVRASDVEVVD